MAKTTSVLELVNVLVPDSESKPLFVNVSGDKVSFSLGRDKPSVASATLRTGFKLVDHKGGEMPDGDYRLNKSLVEVLAVRTDDTSVVEKAGKAIKEAVGKVTPRSGSPVAKPARNGI